MAYREIGMWEILEVLRRIGRGENKSNVARATAHRRKTVRRYVAAAVELGWKPGLEDPTEELAVGVFQKLRPVPEKNRLGDVERLLLPHRAKIKAWLTPEEGSNKRGLRLTKVHQLLDRKGVDVAYSSLHRFAVKHCGFSDCRRFTVRIAESDPGEVAEVDFGRLGLVWDPEKEHNRVAHALIVTLVHSRHQYVHVTHSQKLQDLIGGLEDAWTFFQGVTIRLVIDNLRAAVTKADIYDPVFERVFNEYATYRGFVIDAARVAHAKDKPRVERNVQYVRENFFRGENWLDIGDVQRGAVRWCLKGAGMRIHGTTRKRPLLVFENVEQATLLPLEKERFDPPFWGKYKVHPDHHVSFRKALYSVPTRYVGKTVWVRGDTKLVRIYVGGELAKTHQRQAPGGRSTDYDDYPIEVAPYAMRDPDRLIREAKKQGKHVGEFTEALLSGSFPWAKLRQAQKLQRLCQKYSSRRVDQACRRALAFDLINVHRVEQIIRGDLDRIDLPDEHGAEKSVIQFPLRFERAAESFSHQHIEGDTHDGSENIAEECSETSEALGDHTDSPRPGELRQEGEPQ